MSLTVKNLFKRFDNKWVLKDISLTAESHKILGVFGPTGSGKTMLIKVLAGNEACNGGSIHFRSSDVTKLGCDDRNFHFPSLSNQSFWQSLFNTDRTSQLPDGEGQSLALEKALVETKDILLLDNSFCDMDKQLREANFEKLRQAVKEQGLTVVFTSNDFDEIFEVCDRVAILAGGEIKQEGTPQEVYDMPNSSAVAGIVGRNNLFASRRLTSSKSDHPEFVTIEGGHRLFAEKADLRKLGAINQNVLLAIRPENISISFGASFPEDNLLKAVVKGVRPQGATTIVELDAGGLKLEALVLRLVGLNVGDECMVALPPERIQILRD